MERIEEFVDGRLGGSCIHCGSWDTSSKDHVPSKCLLREPRPENLPVVRVCGNCNNSFAADEEYLFLFLSCVLAGSAEPNRQEDLKAGRALRHHQNLCRRIEGSKTLWKTIDGEEQCTWAPEIERINRVVVKNARGHALYECSESILDAPDHVWTGPISSLSASQREAFEGTRGDGAFALWPEVGSRMMTRLITGQDLVDGWVVVQNGVYRYRLEQAGSILVKSVLFEYLGTEVGWNDAL